MSLRATLLKVAAEVPVCSSGKFLIKQFGISNIKITLA